MVTVLSIWLCRCEGNGNWFKNICDREFLGGPGIRTQHFCCQGPGSIPGQETNIPQTSWHGQNMKKKIFNFKKLKKIYVTEIVKKKKKKRKSVREDIYICMLEDKWRKKAPITWRIRARLCIEYSRVETNRAESHIWKKQFTLYGSSPTDTITFHKVSVN